MEDYVMVRTDDSDRDTELAEAVELPTEEDSTLLLTVLQSQFEGATGLKYRNPNSGLWRGIRIRNGVLHAPALPGGWGNRTYVVVRPKKWDGLGKRGREKGSEEEDDDEEEEEEEGESAHALDGERPNLESSSTNGQGVSDSYHTSYYSSSAKQSEDLIVLGLSYSVTEKEFRDYFEQFGTLVHVELKKDPYTDKSRGFGFIRYKDPKVQWNVFTLIHTLKGRRCDLKRPRKNPTYLPCKFFIGCLPTDPEATTEELRKYFIKYGPLSDVYIPRPYRGFGFITYMDGEDGEKMMGSHHSLRGCALNVTVAEPRGTRSLSQPHGNCYSYSGSGSFSVHSHSGSVSTGHVDSNPQHDGYGVASEYSHMQYGFVGGCQPQVGIAGSNQQSSYGQHQQQTHQQHQYYCNGHIPPPT